MTAVASSAVTGCSSGPAVFRARRTSSAATFSTSFGVTLRFSRPNDTSADIRTGLLTSPAPGWSFTKSFFTSGATALDAIRAPSTPASTMHRA